ncbi:MAG: sugar ABC transporter substrate-binding protein [Caldilineaceae bacterium]
MTLSHVSRRTFLKQMAVISGGAALAACVPAAPTAPSSAASGDTAAAGAAQETQTISFMNWDEIGGTPFETVINAFTEASGIQVDVQPSPAQDYEAKMRTMIAGGTAPDVMRINDDFVRGYTSEGQLLDLTSYLERDGITGEGFFETIYNFPRQPTGEYTAWSVGCQPSVVFYNKTMFEDAGVTLPPTTWTSENWKFADFLAAAQALTVPGERWGALVYSATAFETVFPVANGEPSGIYSFDGNEFTLANEKSIEAIQWVADLTCVHNVQPEWGVVTRSGAPNQLFAGGQLGMYFNAFGVAPYMRQNATDFVWDIAPSPGQEDQKAIATIVCFCIPTVSTNPDGAWDLLSYMSGPDGAKLYADAGAFIPPLREMATYMINNNGDQPPEHISLVIDALENSVTENFSAYIERARSFYRGELELVYTCQSSAEDALTGIRDEVEKALAGEI